MTTLVELAEDRCSVLIQSAVGVRSSLGRRTPKGGTAFRAPWKIGCGSGEGRGKLPSYGRAGTDLWDF